MDQSLTYPTVNCPLLIKYENNFDSRDKQETSVFQIAYGRSYGLLHCNKTNTMN